MSGLWVKIVAFLSVIIAILFYKGKADRAEANTAKRDKIAAEAQKDQLVKTNEALAESQKKAKEKTDAASKDVIPGFFTRRR